MKSHPAGNAGERIVCGVIVKQGVCLSRCHGLGHCLE